MIGLLLSLCLAFADQIDPEELLAEARRRAVIGDFEGTQLVAREALELEGSHEEEARYLLGLGLEYAGDHEEAIAIYDGLLAEVTDEEQRSHIQFRRAEALGRAGRFPEALEQLDALGDPADHAPTDRTKLEILRGLWELELRSRRAERSGLTRIRDALAEATPLDAPQHQAMARSRLAELAAAEAREIRIKGGRRRKARRLEQRATLVTIATDQLVPMVKLDAPYWTLQAFLHAGGAFEDFGQALLDESRVRRLTRDQRVIYEQERARQVETVWVKASRYYDRGVQYAEAVGWAGDEADALRQALAGVVARVDELDAAPPEPSHP